MKYVIALLAAATLAAAPVFAQDSKAVEKEESRQENVEKSTDESGADGDAETEVEIILPDDARRMLKRIRKELERGFEMPDFPEGLPEDAQARINELRKQMEQRVKEMRQRMKKLRKEIEEELEKRDDGDVEREVEEYESEDGRVKIKIVRIRKTSNSSGELPEAPRHEEAPRKQ